MVPERIERLKSDVMQRTSCMEETGPWAHGSWVPDGNPWTRDVALDRIRDNQLSMVQLRAQLLRQVAALSKIEIYPDWTLAGCFRGGYQKGSRYDVASAH